MNVLEMKVVNTQGNSMNTLFRALTLALVVGLGASCDDDSPRPNPNPNNITTPDTGVDMESDVDVDAGDTGTDTGEEDMDPDMPRDCDDECTVGQQVCDGDGGFRICGQFDLDACVEFSQVINCAVGESCQVDRCVPPCRDECPGGSTLCLSETSVGTCGNFDADACLEAGGAVSCDPGERCEQGACVDENVACADECTTGGSVCFGDSVRACGQYDSDACLDLGPPSPCGTGESCSQGQCVPSCTDACADGAVECSGNGVRTCELAGNGCLAWSPVTACGTGESCSNGVCSATCADECAVSNQSVCSPDNTGVSLCGQFDADTCLDRSTPVPCPVGYGCQDGACVATCTDACTQGASQCQGNSIETCGNYDADPCLEWGGAVACPGNATCTNNACDIPCTNECTTNGAVECSGNGVRSCGQFDLDSCLEWSTVTACQSYEVCAVGVCELGPTPAVILINELLYDSVGTDSAAGNMIFLELWGPAGQSLDGYSVVAVNGSGGADYTTISLTGEVVGGDGYFVIAHPNAAPEVLNVADLTDSRIDFQNGPDSVQVRWRGRVVDALGYGNFTASDVFAGEGSPAPQTPAGQSLSRNATHSDTNNNAADFTVQAPSPRASVVVCMDDCTTGQTRCDGVQIQTCGNFDMDACLEFGPSVACSGTQTCQGTTCQDPCTDECSAQGATQCSGTQVRTCGNFDADSCLEWSTAANCPGTQVCTINSCQDPTAPEVVLISPQGTIQTTQGNVHRILVDATPYSGRQISAVRYYANGVLLGSTTATPHEYFYTVPANHPTNSQIVIQAQATDSVGINGSSAFAYLDVRNDAPVASFTATITNTTTVTVDASSSSDTETATNALEVCWDWNNDGTCDTPFSTTLIRSHDFGASGNYTIRMVVRDAVGQTSSTTRPVSFADVQYIGGQDVTTTLWYGTIIVTGNIRVPAGNTLTIAPGTDVLFVYADVVSPTNIGDYRITVDGALVVNGTAAEPVVFSGQDTVAKRPGGWDRIILNGPGSTIDHAVIEYAAIGLEVRNNAAITNTEIRKTTGNCVTLNNGDNASFTDVLVRECGGHGFDVTGGSNPVTMIDVTSQQNGLNGMNIVGSSLVTATTSAFDTNTGEGVRINASTLNLADSVVELNAGRGLYFEDNSGGQVTRNQIRSNGKEGLGLVAGTTQTPNPIVTLNNIYSNSTVGTVLHTEASTSSVLTASVTTGTSTSSAYTAPAGSTIRRVFVNYSESDSSSGSTRVQGFILNGANSSVLQTFTTGFTGWVILPANISSLRVRVEDTNWSSSTDTITISRSELVSSGDADVMAAVNSTVDLRKNYLGTWPNVMTRVSEASAVTLNVQGFVGAPFTSAWDTTIYKSGDETGTWSDTIYVTGNVTIPSGQALNVSPGTQILFVNHDQNSNMVGDFGITATGQFNLNGAVGNEILVAGYGPSDVDMFNTISLNGTAANASTWNDVTLRNARNGVTIVGSSSLTRVFVTTVGLDGFVLTSGSPQLTRVTVDGAGRYGLNMNTASPVLSRLTVRNSLSHGLNYNAGSGGSLEDSTIRDNNGNGIHILNASPAISYNLITYNAGVGIRVEGTSTSQGSYNVIKFNDDAGIALASTTTQHPAPVFNYSNIYGNAVLGSTVAYIHDPRTTLVASVTTGTSTSTTYTVPGGLQARMVRVVYSESDSSSGSTRVRGFILDTANNVLHTLNTSFTGWLVIPAGISGLRVRVEDSNWSSNTDTITVTDLLTSETTLATPYELVSTTISGTSNAKFNYWTPTIGEVPTKIYQSRNGSVDFTGFTGAEYPSGVVTQVGPRP